MSKPWPKVRLGDVLKPTARPVDVKPDELYREIGIRSHGKGVFHKAPISGLELGNKRVFWVQPGDFVLNIVFAWEGAVAVLSEAEAGMIGSHRFPTFRADKSRLDSRFLLAYFKTHEGRVLLGKVSPGGAGRNRTLSKSAFLELPIPLPPIAEQEKLMAQIESAVALTEEASLLRQQAAEESVALMVTMAHRTDLDETRKQKAGWKRMRLSEVISFVDESAKVEPNESYPNLGIYSFGRGLFPKPPISGLATSASVLRRVRSGQFIYSRLFAFEGAYGMVTDEFDGAYVSQEYPTFECEPAQIRIEFLSAYFKATHIWREVAVGSKGLGGRRQRVQPAQLLSHELWLPPLSAQNALAMVQSEADSLRLLQSETAAELDAMLPALLDRAFRQQL